MLTVLCKIFTLLQSFCTTCYLQLREGSSLEHPVVSIACSFSLMGVTAWRSVVAHDQSTRQLLSFRCWLVVALGAW